MFDIKNLTILAPLLVSKALKEDSLQRRKVNLYLSRLMGERRGMWQKLGQALSTQSDHWKELESLSTSKVSQEIDSEDFNKYIESLFRLEELNFNQVKTISKEGITASLSQVHELTLNDEDSINWVIKAKLPFIQHIIEDQLKVFKLASVAQKLSSNRKDFSTTQYFKTFKSAFERELDYEQERENIIELRALTNKGYSAFVPQLHSSLQGNDFILMQKAQGQEWKEVLQNWSPKQKRRLGHALVEQFLFQYFILGRAQGDFHPGNFLFTKTSHAVTISWIDLGHCLTPTLEQRKSLFLAIQGDSDVNLGDLFSAWGFNLTKLSPLKARLPLILQSMFSPLKTMDATNLKSWELKKQLEKIMGQDKWNFRTSGSSELFLSIRCWLGLIGMLEQLNTPLYLGQLWSELQEEIALTLRTITLTGVDFPNVTFEHVAQELRVEIIEDKKILLNISLPAMALQDLTEYLNLEIQEEIRKNSIDLEQIITNALKGGLMPQSILDIQIDKKRYLVTLY